MLGVIQALQIDPLYFGVFTIIALAVGQFTPPVGLNLFIACNIADEKFESIIKEILPYFSIYVIILILFVLFPDIITFIL